MIVDAHLHIYPRFEGFCEHGELKSLPYGTVLYGTGRKVRLQPPGFVDTNFPLEVALEYLDWMGIDKAVLLQAPMYGFWNEYVVEKKNDDIWED